MFQSLRVINNWTVWLSGIVTAGLILRAMIDFFGAMQDAEVGIKDAVQKTKKRIFASIIAITATSLVAFISKFY